MNEWDSLARMVVAAACGSLLGLHAELRDRPGGVRAHGLAAAASALYCATSLQITAPEEAVRAIQGVASGVGFIGAATVLRGRASVQGVGTAASIWMAAAVGCAIGMGTWFLAITATLIATGVNLAYVLVGRDTRGGPSRGSPDAQPCQ